ncbi:hypothetical protein AMBR_JPGBJEAN_02776 [Lacticaseibacillus rhamnosus]|nr:hypothetical protein AMBR_JPGBJEAN_02776 [Lacticaseibacillus rhamnosus]
MQSYDGKKKKIISNKASDQYILNINHKDKKIK